jgi:hypothetical protein
LAKPPICGGKNLYGAVTHNTAPTQYVEADGIRFAYRRFGVPDRTPLVFFQHFMGNLDDHDPALSDAFAADREVILFNNTGVASSSGQCHGPSRTAGRRGPRGRGITGLPQVQSCVGYSAGAGCNRMGEQEPGN